MPNVVPVDQVVVPTSKWQVTIPKKIRENIGLASKKPLNVTAQNGKIVITPIEKIVQEEPWTETRRQKLLKALKEVKGIWADDKDFEKRQKEREKFEIEAVKKMKKAW